MIVYATHHRVSMVSYCNYISKPKLCCPVKSSIQSENMLYIANTAGNCSKIAWATALYLDL